MPYHATAAHRAGHSPVPADAGTSSPWAALQAAVARLREQRRRRRDAHDLQLSSEHMLRDIGIGRSEIAFSIEAGRGTR